MKQQLCWEQLPLHVLELIFDKQVNALDNCAAACTCKAWRDVVHSSKINEMHLHATSASAASHWAVFLRARPAIHHLRLTSVFDHLKPEDSSEEKISSPALSSSLCGALLSCSSVITTGYFAGAFEQMPTDSPSALTELTIKMSGHFLTSRCTDLWSSIPDLQHLQQLTNLHMKVAPDTYGKLDSSLCSLSRTPSMLHSLAIEGSDKFSTPPLNVEVPQVLAARLLTQLNLVNCTVRCLSGALADCLQGLTSLSLRESTVYEDNSFTVTRLTNLVELDLAKAAWLTDGQYLN